MQIMIECEYCNSVYDYKENHSCPNCAAIPNKKQITAAKNAARSEMKSPYAMPGTSVPAPKTSKFMCAIVKLIPLWIAVIVICTFIPGIVENSIESNAVKHLQTIDEPKYEEHNMNEDFVYDGIINLNIDNAFFADSEIINALVPKDMSLLVIHINSSVNNSDDVVNDYYNIEPYITNGEYCRPMISSTALNSCPDAFAQNIFRLSILRYRNASDGYMCFLVDNNSTEFSLCLEETTDVGYVRQLEYIHKISIAVEREENI